MTDLLPVQTASNKMRHESDGKLALEDVDPGAHRFALRIWRETMRTHVTAGCAILVLFLASAVPAPARPMHVLASTPAAETIMRGDHAEYVVRFDGPVDHVQSRIEILRDGHLVESLHPLLDSAPDVLFASSRLPASGHYQIHWLVKSIPDGDTSDGTIAFSVAP
jgi:methionine-rich copper-binding protein CopC